MQLKILPFGQNVFLNKAKTMYKVANGLIPRYIIDLFQSRADSLPNTSLWSVSNQNFTIPKPKCSLYKESLSYSGPKPVLLWATLSKVDTEHLVVVRGLCINKDSGSATQPGLVNSMSGGPW